MSRYDFSVGFNSSRYWAYKRPKTDQTCTKNALTPFVTTYVSLLMKRVASGPKRTGCPGLGPGSFGWALGVLGAVPVGPCPWVAQEALGTPVGVPRAGGGEGLQKHFFKFCFDPIP